MRGEHWRPEKEKDSDGIPYTHANMDTLHTLLTGFLSHIQRDTLHTIIDKKTDSTILNRDSSVSQGRLVNVQEPCRSNSKWVFQSLSSLHRHSKYGTGNIN